MLVDQIVNESEEKVRTGPHESHERLLCHRLRRYVRGRLRRGCPPSVPAREELAKDVARSENPQDSFVAFRRDAADLHGALVQEVEPIRCLTRMKQKLAATIMIHRRQRVESAQFLGRQVVEQTRGAQVPDFLLTGIRRRRDTSLPQSISATHPHDTRVLRTQLASPQHPCRAGKGHCPPYYEVSILTLREAGRVDYSLRYPRVIEGYRDRGTSGIRCCSEADGAGVHLDWVSATELSGDYRGSPEGWLERRDLNGALSPASASGAQSRHRRPCRAVA